MLRRGIKLVVAPLIILNILSGCSGALLSSQPLEKIRLRSEGKSVEDIVKETIPKGMKLSPPMYSKSEKAVIKKDIDGDGKKEILFTFKSEKDDYIGGIIILKERNNMWQN